MGCLIVKNALAKPCFVDLMIEGGQFIVSWVYVDMCCAENGVACVCRLMAKQCSDAHIHQLGSSILLHCCNRFLETQNSCGGCGKVVFEATTVDFCKAVVCSLHNHSGVKEVVMPVAKLVQLLCSFSAHSANTILCEEGGKDAVSQALHQVVQTAGPKSAILADLKSLQQLLLADLFQVG